ncbi:OmpA family protein [Neisseria sp.]|uniref:OmpA family protein n=1 Tax=Neisseria sp. TaxID=192066 RepID=UPI00359FB221
MSENDKDKEQRAGLWVAGTAAAAAVTLVLLFAWGWETGKIEGSPAAGAASAVSDGMNAASAAALHSHGTEASAVYASAASAHTHGHDAAASSAHAAHGHDAAASAASAPAAASAAVAGAAADGARAVVDNGTVKFYFASGKADLAADAETALKDVLAGAKAGKKAVVSGYHDESGNKAKNEELSKQRALAVKNALMGFGVPEAQIELRKPENATGSGDKAEARRVEVVLE